MQKLEDHTPLFVRIPGSLFDAAHAEAKRRQVVLRVVITDALRARFEPEPVSEQPPPRPSPSLLSHSRVVSALVGDEIREAADRANASYSAPSAAAAPRNSSVTPDRPAPKVGKVGVKGEQLRALREAKA